jgi:hypothetical protein
LCIILPISHLLAILCRLLAGIVHLFGTDLELELLKRGLHGEDFNFIGETTKALVTFLDKFIIYVKTDLVLKAKGRDVFLSE